MKTRHFCSSVLVLIGLSFVTPAFAAVPKTITYQGYLKNSNSLPVAEETTINFKLYTTLNGGIAIWTETQTVLPVNGIYTVVLGADAGNALDSSMFTGPVYLGMQIEQDPEMIPRQALTSTPFAIRANVADSVAVGAVGDTSIVGPISNSKLDLSTVVAKAGDTMTGNLNLPADGLTVGTNQLVTSGGKVGIGTSPTEQLEITGNLRLPATTSDSLSGRIMSDGDTLIHNYGSGNFFAGVSAGNLTMTGMGNTATGYGTLSSNDLGNANSAFGGFALGINNTGGNNTAGGWYALLGNESGGNNTALGSFAGIPLNGAPNRTGSNNTFIGADSGPGIDIELTNATAIGYNALVSQDNSLILGNSLAKVGIGTSTPTEKLDVVGNAKVSGTLSAANLSLPANALSIGTNQLVLVDDKMGIGGQPTNAAKLQVYNTAASGQAAFFQNNNPSNVLPAVYGTTSGSGQAIFGLNQGTGRAGHFQILNPGNSASALVAETNGTGYAGEFLGRMRVTGPITSAVATGTAPLTVASTTQVTNLNANLLNGMQASEIITAASDEVRIPISACPVTVGTSGSYYVTQNLSTTGGCISVSTSNVTIDLMGFTISGDGTGIESGIYIFSGVSNLEIRNGTVRNFSHGISGLNSTKNSIRVINVRAVSNTSYGIYLQSTGNLVKDCVAADNGGPGISVGAGSLVMNCTSHNNAHGLIVVDYGTTVTGNTVYANLRTGIIIQGTATVTNNTVHGNGEWGIDNNGLASSGARIAGNTISYNNTSDTASFGGLKLNNNCMVKDNILIGNLQNNIYVAGQRNMIEENLVNGSTNGIYFHLSINYFANNRATGNTDDFNIRAGQIVINGGGNVGF